MYRLTVLGLAVCLALTGCGGRTTLHSPTFSLTPLAQGNESELPEQWSTIIRLIEDTELDSTLKVSVRDGIKRFLADNPAYLMSGWELYYIKNLHTMTREGPGPEQPGRPIYWAVLTFQSPNQVRRAVFGIAVWPMEGAEFDYHKILYPCNDLADIIMSRIFGGPSWGDSLKNPILCRDRNGRLASTLLQ